MSSHTPLPARAPGSCIQTIARRELIKISFHLSRWWATGLGAPAAAYTRAGLGPLCLNVTSFRPQHFQAILVLCCHMFYVILHDIHPLNILP